MTQWQYALCPFEFGNYRDDEKKQSLATLNQWGAQGWEVVAIVGAAGGTGSGSNLEHGELLLKKQIS